MIIASIVTIVILLILLAIVCYMWAKEHDHRTYYEEYCKQTTAHSDAMKEILDAARKNSRESDNIAMGLKTKVNSLENGIRKLAEENDQLKSSGALTDHTVNEAIAKLCDIHKTGDVKDTYYTIEEATELQTELQAYVNAMCKYERNMAAQPFDIANQDHLVEEACDVLTTTLAMLHRFNVTPDTVNEKIVYKAHRAIDRYHENGRL